MAVETPKNWWQPLGKEEKLWSVVIVIWGIIMFIMMPLGHAIGEQNVSQETYAVSIEKFKQKYDEFVNKYKVGDYKGIPIVDVTKAEVTNKKQDAVDVFLLADVDWRFKPVLKMKKGKKYRVHMSSANYQHGFSLLPQNLNYQILPGYDYVITMKPNKAGTSYIVCNEFCMAGGHENMVGKIEVEE